MQINQVFKYQFLDSGMYLQEVTRHSQNGLVVNLHAISNTRVNFWIKFLGDIRSIRTDYLYVRAQDFEKIETIKGEEFVEETMVAEWLDSSYLANNVRNIVSGQRYHHFIVWTGEDRYSEIITNEMPMVYTIQPRLENYDTWQNWSQS